MSIDAKDYISLKSINLMSDKDGVVPKSLAIVPFPSYNLKGAIKSIVSKDEKRRGGIIDSSIIVLFNDANALIFYQYIDQLEILFNDAANRINKLIESKSNKISIEEELSNLYNSILNTFISSFMKKEEKADEKRSVLLLFNLIQKNLDKVINALILGDPVVIMGDRTLVRLIIDTLTMFIIGKSPEIVYWTKDFCLSKIIGGPSSLKEVFRTNILVDLEKGKVIGGKSNNFCKKIINQAKQLDSEHAERMLKDKIKNFSHGINEILKMGKEKKINPKIIDELIKKIDLDEIELIETYLKLKYPKSSDNIETIISECRKKMDKILSGFEKESW